MVEHRVGENDPALGEICPRCNREIQIGDIVYTVESHQKRGNIEFNVDYVYHHSLCR